MAYGSDIDALGNAHRYILSADANDSVGTNHGTNSGGVFTGVKICEDTTNSYLTDGVDDRIVLPSITTINNSAQSRKAVCGWFSATGIQNPPKNIYGEGDATQSFRFILGWGNNLVFEVDSASFTLQVFGDTPLEVDRPYHLCMVFEGSGYGNEIRAYLDGVEQLNAEPTNRQPASATLTARSAGEFGDPAGIVAVGGTEVILLAPINGQYAQWAMFDGTNAVLTDTEIREELFEKGATPTVTITNQAGLDALADTVRANSPLCILVNVAGSISLSADNVTFDPSASIHVQYNGTGTLTWTNSNGANASIGSTTSSGTIVFTEDVTVSVTCLDATDGTPIEDALVYVVDSSAGVVINTLTNPSGIATGTFGYISDDVISSVSKVRKGTASPYYKTSPITGTIKSTGLTTTILMIGDE